MDLCNKLSKFIAIFTFVILLVSIPIFTEATDLKGQIKNEKVSNASNIKVILWKKNAATNKWDKVKETLTGTYGTYYMFNIEPGDYVIQVRGKNYPIVVQDKNQQDLPLIVIS